MNTTTSQNSEVCTSVGQKIFYNICNLFIHTFWSGMILLTVFIATSVSFQNFIQNLEKYGCDDYRGVMWIMITSTIPVMFLAGIWQLADFWKVKTWQDSKIEKIVKMGGWVLGLAFCILLLLNQ